ncbi:MAG: ubiquinol-cytochrome c reductase iron-sulfur subunit [Thermomicrobiales bacterium]|jgi:rieske iron-sulfur protein|nr:ubiquinol-cytochrome c reductase iron-sulfur subunit [Thermomicrobiales bacterium]
MSTSDPRPTTEPATNDDGLDVHPSRRRLLKWLIRLGTGAFALAFAVPALAIRTLQQTRKTVAAGDVLVYATGDRAGQPVVADQLQLGQGAQAFPEGKADNQNNLVELVRIAAGSGTEGLVAYSAICTHLGCSVIAQPNPEGHIVCPCHASMFDPANGARVLRGPASRPLPSLPLTLATNGAVAANGEFSGPVGPQ